jgi:hypothetical protein
MSTRRNLKYKYLKTKIALNKTIQSILEINRKRRTYGKDRVQQQVLNEELKILNAVAENHARSLRVYEQKIENQGLA